MVSTERPWIGKNHTSYAISQHAAAKQRGEAAEAEERIAVP